MTTKTKSSNNSTIRQESECSQIIKNYSSVRNDEEHTISSMFRKIPIKIKGSQKSVQNKHMKSITRAEIPFFDPTENSDSYVSPLRMPGNAKVVFEIKKNEVGSHKRSTEKQYSSMTRTTRTNKDPKFISKVDPKLKKKININNSTTRSIGDGVRQSIKTKTMTNMNLSFDSNLGSDHLAEFLQSKITTKSNNDTVSSPNSDYTHLVRKFGFTF
jgi:hypothetical protein